MPGRIWALTEFPQTIRMIPTLGRPHPPDSDTSFNGDSTARWDGDTLVVDTVAIDTRDAEHLGREDRRRQRVAPQREGARHRALQPAVEELSDLPDHGRKIRRCWCKPFVSAPHMWTLAQDPADVWTEYLCTSNEEPDFWKNVDQKTKDEYEKSGRTPDGAQNGRGR